MEADDERRGKGTEGWNSFWKEISTTEEEGVQEKPFFMKFWRGEGF